MRSWSQFFIPSHVQDCPVTMEFPNRRGKNSIANDAMSPSTLWAQGKSSWLKPAGRKERNRQLWCLDLEPGPSMVKLPLTSNATPPSYALDPNTWAIFNLKSSPPLLCKAQELVFLSSPATPSLSIFGFAAITVGHQPSCLSPPILPLLANSTFHEES